MPRSARSSPRSAVVEPLGKKLRDILTTLSDVKFASFLVLLGLFFWLPLWGFFNLCALYVDGALDTAALYKSLDAGLSWIPALGPWIVGLVSHEVDGVRRVLGESVSHTGFMIILLQLPISVVFERFRAMPSFIFGLAATGATLSGIYAPIYGYFERIGNPGGVWFILAGQMILAVLVFTAFVRFAGEFRIQSE